MLCCSGAAAGNITNIVPFTPVAGRTSGHLDGRAGEEVQVRWRQPPAVEDNQFGELMAKDLVQWRKPSTSASATFAQSWWSATPSRGQSQRGRTSPSERLSIGRGGARGRAIPPEYGIGGLTAYGTLLGEDSYDWVQRDLAQSCRD